MKINPFFLGLSLIFGLILISLAIQSVVRENTGNHTSNAAYVAMITSDWHVEPWFSTGGAEKNNWNPQTVDKWTTPIAKISCKAVGESEKGDTPLALVRSAIEKYVQGVPNRADRLFFFIGDTFSHNLYKLNLQIEASVMYDVMDNLKNYFDSDKIFYVVGNHGGKTNEAFWQPDTISEMWARSLVDSGIFDVNTHTDNELDFFMKCGYYTKPIPNSNIVVICINSIVMNNLGNKKGCDDCDCIQDQFLQLKNDLAKIKSENKFAYIITHYSIDSSNPMKNCQDGTCAKNYIWSVIGKDYQSIVRGIFTGHLHNTVQKMNDWKGGNTWSIPSIYWLWSTKMTGMVSSFISAPFPLNKPLQLAETDVYKTQCKEGELVSQIKWSR